MAGCSKLRRDRASSVDLRLCSRCLQSCKSNWFLCRSRPSALHQEGLDQVREQTAGVKGARSAISLMQPEPLIWLILKKLLLLLLFVLKHFPFHPSCFLLQRWTVGLTSPSSLFPSSLEPQWWASSWSRCCRTWSSETATDKATRGCELAVSCIEETFSSVFWFGLWSNTVWYKYKTTFLCGYSILSYFVWYILLYFTFILLSLFSPFSWLFMKHFVWKDAYK